MLLIEKSLMYQNVHFQWSFCKKVSKDITLMFLLTVKKPTVVTPWSFCKQDKNSRESHKNNLKP